MEWYFGYDYPNSDLNCEDFRSRQKLWDQTRHALHFFQTHLPFAEMRPAGPLASGGESPQVFARVPHVYAVYFPSGGTTSLSVGDGRYTVRWYNPRSGGELQAGSVDSVVGPGMQPLGDPPAEADQDWAVLVKRMDAK